MKITKNTVISLAYTLKNDTGEILDTSTGREPLVYLHGVGALIPGLESAIEGLTVGDSKSVIIQPEDAYGKRSDNLIHKVSKGGFQGEEEMTVGMQVQLEMEEGPMVAAITNIEGDEVTLDLNHPLADEVLHFEIAVENIRMATEEEVQHGHVHGEGGHHH
jgi:FKBP-type peptidyl-prolyl cis-trans isomerase SlyD